LTNDNFLFPSDDRVPWLVSVVVDGNVRFFSSSLSLQDHVVPPFLLNTNFFKIVNGMFALNNMLNLDLGLKELQYCYNLYQSLLEVFYLASKHQDWDRSLVRLFLGTYTAETDDVVLVSGGYPLFTEVYTPHFLPPLRLGRHRLHNQ